MGRPARCRAGAGRYCGCAGLPTSGFSDDLDQVFGVTAGESVAVVFSDANGACMDIPGHATRLDIAQPIVAVQRDFLKQGLDDGVVLEDFFDEVAGREIPARHARRGRYGQKRRDRGLEDRRTPARGVPAGRPPQWARRTAVPVRRTVRRRSRTVRGAVPALPLPTRPPSLLDARIQRC